MKPNNGSADRGGFTLIEIMIVMLIIGLVAAIAYPQYQVLSRANLRETSRKLAGTIRYLYARSIMDKKPWRLVFDMGKNRVWAERLEPRNDGAGSEYIKIQTAGLRRIEIPNGVIIKNMRVLGREVNASGVEYLNFNPYGGVERAVIHLEHENHRWVFSLVTKPLSGRVAIFDYEVDIEQVPIEGESGI